MTSLSLVAKQGLELSSQWMTRRRRSVLAIALGLTLWAMADPEVSGLVLTSLSDAYLQVSVFVAATLALFHGLERGFNIDAATWLQRHRRWQIPAAALLGALPGCGGAIIVMTQYVQGQLGFGAVLAVLTATMGDAAFLLLSREPMTGLMVFGLGMGVGMISGYVVEAVHGRDFMRRQVSDAPVPVPRPVGKFELGVQFSWLLLLGPGVVLGLMMAFQIDADAVIGSAVFPEPSLWIGAVGAVLAIAMWALGPARDGLEASSLQDKVIADTNFVTVWVVAALLAFELSLYGLGWDLAALFHSWGGLVPLVGVLVGLLPGCGPQVVVTTLYLNGIIPLSAQLGNAISNDGDALFPALALAPKASLIATLYSAVPALIVGYGVWFLFE